MARKTQGQTNYAGSREGSQALSSHKKNQQISMRIRRTTDCDIASEPTIFTNCYRASEFRTFDSVTEKRVERVCGSEEGAIGAYEGPGTNTDEACV